jgi:pilus assembly protein CpaE
VLKDDTVAAVQGLLEDRRLSRSRMAVQTGGIQAATNYLSANDTPQLLIVEAKETGDALFEQIEMLAEVCDPNSNVMLIGSENDIALYRELKTMGLAEYFSGAVDSDQLMASIEGAFSDNSEAALGQSIAFIGSRGGVGSSVLAINAAQRLGEELDDDVIHIDCDLSFGTAALMCNLDPKQSLADVLAQPGRLDETLVERVKLSVDDHLSVLPAPSALTGDFDIDVEAFEAMMRLSRSMAGQVVLDIPHVWAPWVQDVLVDSSRVVLVTTPDLAGMRDTKHIKDAVAKRGDLESRFHVVFNKAGMSRKTEISAKDFAGQIEVDPDVIVPWDPILFGTALNNGEMLTKTGKSSKVVTELDKLVQIISGVEPVDKKAKGKGKARGRKKAGRSAFGFAR